MTVILALAVLAWHIFLLRPAIRCATRQVPPRPVDFALLSFILYYDVGLILEAAGVEYNAPGFVPLRDAEAQVRLFVYSALVVAPPAILLGARWARSKNLIWQKPSKRSLTPDQNKNFLMLAAVVTSCAAAISLSALYTAGSIPAARLVTSQWLGAGVIFLYIPLGLTAFYAMTVPSNSRRGLVVSLSLAAGSAVGVLSLGQRTLLLVPFLMVAIARFRFRPTTFAAAAGVILVLIVSLGTVFKPSGVSAADNPSVFGTINESLARAPVMAEAVVRSEPIGTSVMAYPGEGYVYSALLYAPRTIAPFKGESTAHRFTDSIEGSDRFGRWAYGVGMLEEAVLNVGLVPALAVLAGFGSLLGALERVVAARPALILPVSGGAVWLCGYHLPAVLLLFGSMFIVVLVLDAWATGVRLASFRNLSFWRAHSASHRDEPISGGRRGDRERSTSSGRNEEPTTRNDQT